MTEQLLTALLGKITDGLTVFVLLVAVAEAIALKLVWARLNFVSDREVGGLSKSTEVANRSTDVAEKAQALNERLLQDLRGRGS